MSRPKKLTNDDGTLFIPKRLQPSYKGLDATIKAELEFMNPKMARFILESEHRKRAIYRKVDRINKERAG